MMIKWLSDRIVNYFRDKSISAINADPIYIARIHFKSSVNLLKSKYGGLSELYWVGSFKYTDNIFSYFKNSTLIDLDTMANIPFERNTRDEKIVDLFIGSVAPEKCILAFFLDDSNLDSNSCLIDDFVREKEHSFILHDQNYTKLI
jgi:hypothetical protein